MFNDSKYTKWYRALIAQAQHRVVGSEYHETHHIVPKSLGGDNSPSNKVVLTAREHYICHLLLPKMCTDTKSRAKMVKAYLMMANAEPRHTTSNRYTSKLYQTMKTSYVRSISGINSSLFGAYWSSERKLEQSKRLSELKLSTGTVRTNIPKPKISQPHKNQQLDVNKNNPMYGKHHTEEAKQKMSATRRENYKTGGAEYQAKMVRANPRSRPVITPEGTFPSLSAARRHFGLVSKYSATIRIRQGEWKYS